jgi:hypothetical protein
VTFVDGNRVKYPPTMQSSTSHKTLTRKEYHIQTTLNTKNTSLHILDKKSSHVSSQESFRKNSRLNSKRDLLDEIPDYDNLGDVIEESHLDIIPIQYQKHHGKITLYGPGYEYNEGSPLNKFNSEIMRNKNWGTNPGMKKPALPERLPKRPNSKDLREIYGDIIKKPKDQPFITSKELWDMQGSKIKKPKERPYLEKVEKKTRMPAPRYGFTMINALPDYEELVKSNGNMLK